MNNNTYATFDLSELYKINFREVLQTEAATVRVSVDGINGIISWNGETPESVLTLTTISSLYNQVEMFEICLTSEWNKAIKF